MFLCRTLSHKCEDKVNMSLTSLFSTNSQWSLNRKVFWRLCGSINYTYIHLYRRYLYVYVHLNLCMYSSYMYRSNLCPSLYPFIHLFLCSWTASFCQVWPSCFICVYPCFQLPNMRHLVAMAPYCRSMCRRERVCPYCPLFFLLATHPPHSPPSLSLSGLCAALFIWAAVRGATQTHWSDFDCAPASVVALKLSSDGG